jgi:hypothetical protein
MKQGDDFFIGWSAETPPANRRFLLAAGLALIAGGGAIAAGVSSHRAPIGDGVWNMGERRILRGLLKPSPYPSLHTQDLDGAMRTVFLATAGKTAPRIGPGMMDNSVAVTGTLIRRGANAMIAVEQIAPAPEVGAASAPATTMIDRGPVTLIGEILDAKCWFGAMRPGYGKTHKSCAALCARGGLPLAFCQLASCGDAREAPLFLDQDGRAFGREILPLVADPIVVEGRLIQVADVLQLRTAFGAIRRV